VIGRAIAGLALLAAACSSTLGRPLPVSRFEREPGWTAVRGATHVAQEGDMGCGPAATATLLAFWGRPETPAAIGRETRVTGERGATAGALRDLLRARGLSAHLIAGAHDDLERELAAGRPVLVGSLRKGPGGLVGHYLVVVGLHRGKQQVAVIDPAAGWREIPLPDFAEVWTAARRVLIVAFPPV
jgi:predicted double-glycine peptidase